MSANRLPYFKAYDIRGTVPDQINETVAYQVGQAVAEWSGSEEVIVGRDARLSSPGLAESLINGLTDQGVNVTDTGLVTTPMLNYAVARHGQYGLMVTASHNPKEYNGIKVIDPHVEQVYYGRGLESLEALVLRKQFEKPNRRGKIRVRSILDDYEEYLSDKFGNVSFASVSAVVDCSNGVGGIPLGVFETLGIRHRLLYHVPDGSFPNHDCDTLRSENLQGVRREVSNEKASLGIMFDGDSDRVVFIDEQCDHVPLDLVFILLARQVLARQTGRIFYDLRFSRGVKEEIEKLGGTPVMMRVGNPFHKEALHRNEDGLLAAELSGHIMYRDHFGIDDPLYASLRLMSYLAECDTSLSDLIRPLKRYVTSGEIRIRTDHPEELVEKVRSRYADGKVAELDGITVEYPEWWFNLRPSNTEPVAKLVIEANSEKQLTRIKSELLDFLK